jgi:hypothetical protein
VTVARKQLRDALVGVRAICTQAVDSAPGGWCASVQGLNQDGHAHARLRSEIEKVVSGADRMFAFSTGTQGEVRATLHMMQAAILASRWFAAKSIDA